MLFTISSSSLRSTLSLSPSSSTTTPYVFAIPLLNEITDICTNSKWSFHKKILHLQKIEKYIVQSTFLYAESRPDLYGALSIRIGKIALLQLWEFLYSYYHTLGLYDIEIRLLFYRLSYSITKREEFGYQPFNLRRNVKTPITMNLTEDQHYTKLLFRSLQYVASQLIGIINHDLVEFACQLYSVAAIRFPYFGEKIIECIMIGTQVMDHPGSAVCIDVASLPENEIKDGRRNDDKYYSIDEYNEDMNNKVADPVGETIHDKIKWNDDRVEKEKKQGENVIRSPRQYGNRYWTNYISMEIENFKCEDGIKDNMRTFLPWQKSILKAYENYKEFRDYECMRRKKKLETVAGTPLEEKKKNQRLMQKGSVDWNVEQCFQKGMELAQEIDSSAGLPKVYLYILSSPNLFYMKPIGESQLHTYIQRRRGTWSSLTFPNSSSSAELLSKLDSQYATQQRNSGAATISVKNEKSINLWQTFDILMYKLQSPQRHQLMILPFITTYLSTSIALSGTYKEIIGEFYNGKNIKKRRKDIIWHCIPGYNTCIRAVIAVFKRICQRRRHNKPQNDEDMWSNYWEPYELKQVLNCLYVVLQNPDLINPFVQIVFEGLNLYDLVSVDYSIDLLDDLLFIAAKAHMSTKNETLVGKKRKEKSRMRLPRQFDISYFLALLKRLMLSVNFQVLLKVFTFLYRNIELFDSNKRKRLVSELFLRSETFFIFFLHWNEEVRRIFYHILIYKVFSSSRLYLPCHTDDILLQANDTSYATPSNILVKKNNPPKTNHQSSVFSQMLDMTYQFFDHNFGFLSNSTTAESAVENGNEGRHRSYAYQTEQHNTTTTKKRMTEMPTSLRLLCESRGNNPHQSTIPLSSRLQRTALLSKVSATSEVSTDLCLASRVEGLFQMLVEQMILSSNSTSKDKCMENGKYFPKKLEIYTERAVSEYTVLLRIYYEMAIKSSKNLPKAPELEFFIRTSNRPEI